MTNWAELKVVDLKAALKKRGLPQTGLKPALVARLTEAELQDGTESETTIQDDDKQDASSAASPDTIPTLLPSSGLSTELLPAAIPDAQPNPPAQIETAVVSTSEIPEAQIESADDGNFQDSNVPIAQTESLLPQSPDVIPPSQPSDSHVSALPSLEPQEAIEDRLKRKRRSASPSISTEDAARKRIRTEDAPQGDEGISTTQGNADWVEKHNGVDAEGVNAEAMEVEVTESVLPEPTIVDTSKEEVPVESVTALNQIDVATTQSDADWVEKHNAIDAQGVNAEAMEVEVAGSVLPESTIVDASKEEVLVESVTVSNQMDVDALEDGKVNTQDTTTTQSQEDTSKNRDSRFTNLFSKSSQPQSHDLPSDTVEYETDRLIAPARHPATSALYIRNFMRPLNAIQLQSHLATLATPPGQEVDSEIILNFYLDPIKTHAFVILANTSAASRVRSAFHDRIWPDEKTRKPLWVDFVPVEKAEEWIATEMGSNSGGRGQAKKWEVTYYTDEDRHVTATLQEVSSLSHQIYTRRPSGPGGHAQSSVPERTFQPPTAPRGFVHEPQKPAANIARLDQLFESTTTKPVLYFKPVAKELANKRLDNIDAALSKDGEAGRRIAGEIHRYTFENNDVLVDRGPEIFAGIRPPIRGGRGGGGGGRGGNNSRPRGNGGDRGYGGYGGDRGGGSGRRYDSYRGDERRNSRDDSYRRY